MTLATDGASFLQHVERLRRNTGQAMKTAQKSELGQFFTPGPVAEMMASLFTCQAPVISLLDAGAGTGALLAACVAAFCQRQPRPKRIEVTAFEIDKALADPLSCTLELCRIQCEATGIEFCGQALHSDFLRSAVAMLDNNLFSSTPPQRFNCAILNPPYRKIRSSSEARLLLRQIGVETSNFYTGFLATAVHLLDESGELVAITPRSFCNGPYFQSFRKSFLKSMALRRFHLFESRELAFRDDDVLQENIIFHAVKEKQHPVKVMITANAGPNDENMSAHEVPYEEMVHPKDPRSFIRIVQNASEQQIAEQMTCLRMNLSDLGMSVSTGRVVEFRVKEFLRLQPEAGTAPLIYPAHFECVSVRWPKIGIKKPNAIIRSDRTEAQLIPNENYVLVKRFSAKEEKKRIVAVVYDSDQAPGLVIGFENHLNYFHRDGHGLSLPLARGLAAYLNSTLVDSYFRQFNGHTQVNATDLRSLKYPTLNQLETIGRKMPAGLLSQGELDQLIAAELRETSDQEGVPE